MVSQNVPFTPIYDAWKAGSRALLSVDDEVARQQAGEICAKVLSNRKPPYSVKGGLFDALTETKGDVWVATNEEAREAMELFRTLEGADIEPAAGVATASLIKAVKEGKVNKEAVIMLNITGGGIQRFKREHNLVYKKPDYVFPIDAEPGFIKEKVAELFG